MYDYGSVQDEHHIAYEVEKFCAAELVFGLAEFEYHMRVSLCFVNKVNKWVKHPLLILQ